MSSAPSGFQAPKTNWASADVVAPADMNRIEGNINAIETSSRTVDPAQTPTGNSGSLRQLLDWFANRIKAITGTTNWYDAPPITLQALVNHKSRHATGGADALSPADIGAAPASHTHTPAQISPQGAGSGLDADTVDGYHAGNGPNQVAVRDSGGYLLGGQLSRTVFGPFTITSTTSPQTVASVQITTQQSGIVVAQAFVEMWSPPASGRLSLLIDGVAKEALLTSARPATLVAMASVGPGTHTAELQASCSSTGQALYASGDRAIDGSTSKAGWLAIMAF